MSIHKAMTVRELIEKLRALQNMEAKIVSYYNSGYSFVEKDADVSISRLVDKGGYVDHATNSAQKARETDCVVLPG